jgi:D-cysteine desulfhydrase
MKVPPTDPLGTLPALFRWHPEVEEHIPWIPLGRFPTPVQPLELELPGDWWVKRDDLTGEAYGGNKVRKLEFLLGAARRAGAGRLITAGATGSHHVLATTVHARSLALPVTAVLFPQPPGRHAGETLRHTHVQGASLVWSPRMETIPLLLQAAMFRRRRERPFLVPPGGSDPMGTLGYVSAALELAGQVAEGAAPMPETIHVATGTMGTAVGLAIGLELAGLPTRVVAVRITRALLTNRLTLRSLTRRTLAFLAAAGISLSPAAVLRRIEMQHDEIGRGYGHPTGGGERAAALLAGHGLLVDPTYTAKAAAAFLSSAGEAGGGPRLLWLTLSSRTPPPPIDYAAEPLPPRFHRWLERSR